MKSRNKKKKREKREGKEEVEGKKSEINLSIVISKNRGITRRKLNRVMPYNIDYIDLLIYINDKQ